MPNPNSPSARGADRRKATRRRDTTGSLDRLLEGAQATFAERGYHQANIHEICARANVGIGTFYAHFDHKSQLLEHLMVERAVALPQLLTPDDLADVATLTARLRGTLDDPAAAGLWRAWYDAVAEDQGLARSDAKSRSTTLKQLRALVTKARRGRPAKGPRVEAGVVAWTMMLFARELSIHDRDGAPSVETVARLIHELVFGPPARKTPA
jgi:AcrR family transcriptional regulator